MEISEVRLSKPSFFIKLKYLFVSIKVCGDIKIEYASMPLFINVFKCLCVENNSLTCCCVSMMCSCERRNFNEYCVIIFKTFHNKAIEIKNSNTKDCSITLKSLPFVVFTLVLTIEKLSNKFLSTSFLFSSISEFRLFLTETETFVGLYNPY